MKVRFQAVVDMSSEDIAKVEKFKNDNELEKESDFLKHCIKYTLDSWKGGKNGRKG